MEDPAHLRNCPWWHYLFGFMYIDYDGDLGTFRISKMILSVHLPTPVAALQSTRALAKIHKKMIVKVQMQFDM